MLWHEHLDLRMRFFIQRSRNPDKLYGFHCAACNEYAKGIYKGNQTVKSKKGKDLEYKQTIRVHDYDSLEHCTEAGDKINPLVHKENCKWFKEYMEIITPKDEPTVVALYCDGGVINRNPSLLGGTWAWCGVDAQGKRVIERGGIIEVVGDRPVTNNWTEQIAITLALEAMPDGWHGTVYSDSQIALGRVFKGWRTENLPNNIKQRGIVALRRLGTIKHTLLQGHPTKADLARGVGAKRGFPVSEHNVWCDKECGRQAELYRTRNFQIVVNQSQEKEDEGLLEVVSEQQEQGLYL